MDRRDRGSAKSATATSGKSKGNQSSTTPRKDPGVFTPGCTDDLQKRNQRASGAAIKGAVSWTQVTALSKRTQRPVAIGVPDPYKQPSAGPKSPAPPPRDGTKQNGPKTPPLKSAKPNVNTSIPAPNRKPTNGSANQSSANKKQPKGRAADGSGAQAEQSRSVIEEADEDTQRRDDEEILHQQPWHRGITQAMGVPANGAGSQTANGIPNLTGTCRTLVDYERYCTQHRLYTGHVWIKLHHIPMGSQCQLMEQLLQTGDCDGNLWVIDDQATAHLGNVSPEKKRRWLWLSIVMPADNYRNLKFIDNCYDLSRGGLPQAVPGTHAQLDVFSGLKGREFKAIVQIDEFGRMHSLDTGSQFDNHVKYARLINSIRLALNIDDDYLVDIRSRYKPEWKAKISIVFLETEDQRVTIEIQYSAYVRNNGKEPIIELDGLQYKLCTFEVARLAKDTAWEQVMDQIKKSEAASQGRRCFINGIDYQPTPEQIVTILQKCQIELESTPIITRSKHPSSKGKPQWRALVVCTSDEEALWLCIQGPKIPIGNGRLYIKPAQPRGSRNLKEAQDAEELRHRDFGPTDGLNAAQLDMLKQQMLRTSGDTAIRECKKMQEHLELVAKGAAGMSPQHSSLYNSLSERMVKAERRITDVESNQDQHRLELAQPRYYIDDIRSHQGLAAGEADLGDAHACKQLSDAQNFVCQQHVALRRQLHAFRRHAVFATQVAFFSE